MLWFELLPVLANKVMQNKGPHAEHRDFDLDQEHLTAAPPSINQTICFKVVQIICFKEVDSLSIVALAMFMLCSRRVTLRAQSDETATFVKKKKKTFRMLINKPKTLTD